MISIKIIIDNQPQENNLMKTTTFDNFLDAINYLEEQEHNYAT